MSDLYDSVNPNTIPGDATAVAGYDDGPDSQWPAAGWQRWADVAQIHITVLANEASEAFDGETSNAGPDAVAAAIANRVADGKWCWLYANQEQMPAYLASLAAKGIRPTDRQFFPNPGCYLWPADPSGNIAKGTWRLPVDPVAVQDRWEGSYDVSTLYVTLPGPQPAPDQPTTPPTEAPFVNLFKQLIDIPTGPDGVGWTPTPVAIPFATVAGVEVNPQNRAEGQPPTSGTAKAAEWGAGTYVEVEGCPPNTTVGVWIAYTTA